MNFRLLEFLATLNITYATALTPNSFPAAVKRSQETNTTSPLQIDLGYSIYEGYYNATDGLNEWKGIRYAAPPTGSRRWQAPQPPIYSRSSVIQANGIPSQCPQRRLNRDEPGYNVILTNTAPNIGEEDCLFLSVFVPPGAQNLPVLVWIHEGGYGAGNGMLDLGPIINGNNGSFIGVSIQYRLGAFGFLSSHEVNRFGVVNAGLRDQMFALEWVQNYIHLFGGNASQVTISGNSAGAGSVMLHTMAYRGTFGTSLFTNAIVSSPYLPMQYGYSDWYSSQNYYAFAQHAGCLTGNAAGAVGDSQTIFEWLVSKDTAILKNASAIVGASVMEATWACGCLCVGGRERGEV